MTCQLTTVDHIDYGLTNTLDPNKRHQTLGTDLLNPEKIPMGIVIIKVALWLRKARYKKAWGALARRQAALNRPQTKGFGHTSRVSGLNVINMVFKSLRAQKVEDRCKARHFGRASQTRTTCALTLADHNDYGLTHTLDPNKRDLNIDSDSASPEKITNRSKWPHDHQI